MKAKRIILFKFNELCKESQELAIIEQEGYLCEECEVKAEELGLSKREAAVMSLEKGNLDFLVTGEVFVY